MQKRYLEIYQDIERKINEGVWKKSELLPSENELATIYQVSRDTIRKALHLLAQEGYIQKVRGKGSVIIGSNKFSFPISKIESFKELATHLKLQTKTIVHELSITEADQKLQAALKVKQGTPIWKAIRVREISGEKVILDKDYFNKEFVSLLTKQICEDSIYDHLENKEDLKISYARKEIMIEEATSEDYELLDMEGFSNIVVIKSKVYLEDTSLFQYTESRHRPDKFRFVDFARRVQG